MSLPQLFFGMHFVPGCAEYAEAGKEPYRIFLNEETIKGMDASFQGRPVYVKHVNEVNLENIQEADGYVVRSFYNPTDGKHWAEFLVVSDKGHEAIRSGWRLSNAYIPKEFAGGGLWNGITYQKEVTRGEYEHLAIVPNPRYDESIILTPAQFKEYNEKKELEIKRLANSKGEKSVLNLFKKTKVENAADLEQTIVSLPLSGIDMSVMQVVNELDAIKNMHGYANGDHMVKVGEEEMSVNQLIKAHGKMKNDEKDRVAKEEEAAAAAKKNEEEEVEEKKENEVEKKDHFESLKNAHLKGKETSKISLDGLARGKARYGSI